MEFVKSLLMVGFGSFFGGALRYFISVLMRGFCGAGFPWATLFAKCGSIGNSWCLLLTTGFCGGFTTFSTFANESMAMLRDGNIVALVGYIALCIIVGIALVAFGYWLVKQ